LSFEKRDTWNHSQFLFNNLNNDIINHSNHRIFILSCWLWVDIFFFSFVSYLKNKKSKITKQNIEKHRNKYKTTYIVTKQNTHVRDNTQCVTSILFVQFMFILLTRYLVYGMIYWIWYLPAYNSIHCKYTHHAVHTANINNSVHCTCMYHVLLHIRFTLFTFSK
jgi:uncharacterized ion transporter superfamily protein YfcC